MEGSKDYIETEVTISNPDDHVYELCSDIKDASDNNRRTSDNNGNLPEKVDGGECEENFSGFLMMSSCLETNERKGDIDSKNDIEGDETLLGRNAVEDYELSAWTIVNNDDVVDATTLKTDDGDKATTDKNESLADNTDCAVDNEDVTAENGDVTADNGGVTVDNGDVTADNGDSLAVNDDVTVGGSSKGIDSEQSDLVITGGDDVDSKLSDASTRNGETESYCNEPSSTSSKSSVVNATNVRPSNKKEFDDEPIHMTLDEVKFSLQQLYGGTVGKKLSGASAAEQQPPKTVPYVSSLSNVKTLLPLRSAAASLPATSIIMGKKPFHIKLRPRKPTTSGSNPAATGTGCCSNTIEQKERLQQNRKSFPSTIKQTFCDLFGVANGSTKKKTSSPTSSSSPSS